MANFKINSITAFLAIDPVDGDEGIIGLPVPGSKALSLPAIAADQKRLDELFPLIENYSKSVGFDYRVVEFNKRNDITKKFKAKNRKNEDEY